MSNHHTAADYASIGPLTIGRSAYALGFKPAHRSAANDDWDDLNPIPPGSMLA